MVDLVKIRKKAKKKAAEDAAAEAAQAPAGAPAEAVTSAAPEASPAAAKAAPDSGKAAPPAPSTQPLGASAARNDSAATTGGSSKLDRFKEEAGRRREEVAFGAAALDVSPEDQLELLTFVIAGEQYAAEIEHVIEIVTPRAVTRVPNAERPIVGIMSLRGTIVTLLDVRRRLRHPASPETPETRVIVLDHQGETVGFEVDNVLRVVKLPASMVEAHPIVHASEVDESIRGVFRHNEALTILLDVDKLLEGSRDGGSPSANERIAPRA